MIFLTRSIFCPQSNPSWSAYGTYKSGHGLRRRHILYASFGQQCPRYATGLFHNNHYRIRSLSLNLFIDGRDGYFYTNRVSLQGMRDFIRKAVEATRMLESDIAQTLPDPARYYRGGGVDLRTADPLLPAVTPQEKTRLALACNQEIAGKHPALISADTRYSDHYSRLWYLVSNGRS